ncbi:hypothetical protein WK13_34540 [Burkholderia ubonensis]|uniref:MmcB family DNA repair protein n=1 Tax=Burkholderia ubonensis TaxID=101571 RepID=UPI000753E2CD|nr:MmcB family DNA repair protein [Burkholderia ubonensis]KVR21658.1 hypothetical protein WK13_34540 [Burkholderia ubonensis]
MKTYNEASIQRALACWFDVHRQMVCVPNVMLFDWEMDFCAITKAGVIIECEVKISLSDWQADQHKDKWKSRHQAKVGRFYYAVPHFLAHKVPDWVPETTGIIALGTDDTGYTAQVMKEVRPAALLTKYRAANRDIEYLYRGCYFRYWDKKMGCV